MHPASGTAAYHHTLHGNDPAGEQLLPAFVVRYEWTNNPIIRCTDLSGRPASGRSNRMGLLCIINILVPTPLRGRSKGVSADRKGVLLSIRNASRIFGIPEKRGYFLDAIRSEECRFLYKGLHLPVVYCLRLNICYISQKQWGMGIMKPLVLQHCTVIEVRIAVQA